MDPSVPLSDCQTKSLPPLSDCQTENLVPSLLHSPKEITSFAYETQTEMASDLSDSVKEPMFLKDKPTGPILTLSNCLSQETATNCLDSTEPMSPILCNLTGHLSSCLEDNTMRESRSSALDCHTQASGICELDCSNSEEPLSPLVHVTPHLSHSFTGSASNPSKGISGPSETFSEFQVEHELTLSDSLAQDSRITGLCASLEQTLTEPVSHHSSSLMQDTRDTGLFRSLSPLSDSSTEIDTATGPLTDLYIFEKGTQDFILSPQSPDLDPREINCTDNTSSSLLSSSSSFKPEDNEMDPDRDTHVLSPGHHHYPAVTVTQAHHQMSKTGNSARVDPEPEVGQRIGSRPPAVAAFEGGLLSKSVLSPGKAEHSGSTPPARRSDSPNELWLDACQFLAGEEDGDDARRTLLDEWGQSTMGGRPWATRDTSSPPGDTKVSGFVPGEGDGIGQASGDMRGWGPPVERWSSVDSWASALSDWAAIITSPQEDFTAAFTEIGAEIDALTQALAETHIDTQTETPEQTDTLTETLIEGPGQDKSQAEAQEHPQSQLQTQPPMAIQDHALEPQPTPESSILPGQGCLSSSLTEPAELPVLAELQDREESQPEDSYILTTTTQGDEEPEETKTTKDERSPCPTDEHSSLGSPCGMSASPGGYGVDITDLIPGSPSSAPLDDLAPDMSLLGGCAAEMETDIDMSNKEDPIILHITEDTDEGLENQNALSQLKVEEPFRDVVCKVTEGHSVSELGLVAEEGGERSYGSAVSVSGFPAGTEAETPKVESECTEGLERLTDLHFLNKHTLTNAHVFAEDTPPGGDTNVQAHVSCDTSQDLHKACQEEPQRWSPQFIMPLAPLCIGPSFYHQTNTSALDGDQARANKSSLNDNKGYSCPYIQPHIPWPTFVGITDKPPLGSQEEKLLIDRKENTTRSSERSSSDEEKGELTIYSGQFLNKDSFDSSLSGESTKDLSLSDSKTVTTSQEINDLGRELSNLVAVPEDHFLVSEKDRVAYVTLDLVDPLISRTTKPITTTTTTGLQSDQAAEQLFESDQKRDSKMPHKTNKSSKQHHAAQASNKQDNVPHLHSAQQASKTQENHPPMDDTHTKHDALTGHEDKEAGSVTVTETTVVPEKVTAKHHSKKKKKHSQNATVVKNEAELLVEVENGAKQKTAIGKIDIFEAKSGKTNDKVTVLPGKKDSGQSDSAQKKSHQPAVKAVAVKTVVEANAGQGAEPPCGVAAKDHQPISSTGQPSDDVIKRRRLSEDKFGKMVSTLESKLAGKPESSIKEPKAGVESTRRKAYSEVVKQKTHTPKEAPKVVQPIQAAAVSEDPQSLCLWCQFNAVLSDYTVTWTREGTVLAEIKRSAGDESRVSVIISKASHKDLGKYQCRLNGPHGSVTLDYQLTYELLSEIVIPETPKNIPAALVEVEGEEEDVRCSRLMFKEDFLSDQYFGENQPASIVTEKVHFGEGMHRRAFRTKLQAGMVPLFTAGHPCVLKVHNSISYGTKNNEELVQRNFDLAVEECQVQNTAREYIKAYNAVAKSAEAFGEVPEIIPIFLVHRPSSDIPYATLEEELIGDFVKYSVRDGKEINLMRRNSEAGQKCCAFQHWVYHKTDGNLLVTDMQGVGMRLTDVGIATCKKGYKGFRGNCATTFIDQFKALHQCNKYCEILGLKSLQPKPKKASSAPKPKTQPTAAPKKKTFGPTVKNKS